MHFTSGLVTCVCLDSQHHLMAEGPFLALGMLCIPSVQFLLEMKTRVYIDAISVCCRAQGMLTADAQQVPLKLCVSAWDY